MNISPLYDCMDRPLLYFLLCCADNRNGEWPECYRVSAVELVNKENIHYSLQWKSFIIYCSENSNNSLYGIFILPGK